MTSGPYLDHGPFELTVADLPEAEAMALAQFVKRLCWSDFRVCAVDDAEARTIRSAVDRLRRALRQAGFAPR